MLVVHHVTRHLRVRIDFRRAWHFVTFWRSTELLNTIRCFWWEVVRVRVLVGNGFELFLTAHVFTDGNVLHFCSDDALLGVPFLRHWMTSRSTKRVTLETWVFLQLVLRCFVLVILLSVRVRKVAIIFRLHVTTFVFFDITTLENPLATEFWKAFRHVTIVMWVAPRTRTVVNTDRIILLDHTIRMLSV